MSAFGVNGLEEIYFKMKLRERKCKKPDEDIALVALGVLRAPRVEELPVKIEIDNSFDVFADRQ
jgi:hypothetical protein